jgi:hypothetical protein
MCRLISENILKKFCLQNYTFSILKECIKITYHKIFHSFVSRLLSPALDSRPQCLFENIFEALNYLITYYFGMIIPLGENNVFSPKTSNVSLDVDWSVM